MRFVLWLVAAIAAAYGGYWYTGSRALLGGTNSALSDLRAAGLADFGEVTLSGFPSRFDLKVSDPQFTSADGTLEWSAAEANIHALSYKPNHIITVLPDRQTLKIGREEITLTSTDLRASAVFGVTSDLPLDHATLVGADVAAASSSGWTLSGSQLRAAIRQGAAPNAPEIGIDLTGLTLTGLVADRAAAAGVPVQADHARLNGIIGLNQVLNRHTPMSDLHLQSADIRAIELDWGNIEIRGRGALAILPSGYPDGRIDLDVRNWSEALDLAISLGLAPSNMRQNLFNAFTFMAASSGNPAVLNLPLIFTSGRMSLGPVPLGPAPRF